jgi:hypothetical protein
MPPLENISAAAAIQQALVATLRDPTKAVRPWLHENPAGGPALAADSFARVYGARSVPAELRGRWIVVDNIGEQWARAFMRSGSAVRVTLHLWHTPVEGDDTGNAVTLETWARVASVLSARIPLGGHWLMSGTPSLVDVVPDTDGESWHGVVRYDALTRANA